MVIALVGESCTGKSAVADALRDACGATVYTGKDYLRFDKQETAARQKFMDCLSGVPADAAVVYVVSEKEQLSLLPDSCFRVLLTADLASIQARFARRMGGRLPPPVAAMLSRKHGVFDQEPHALHFQTDQTTPAEICAAILSSCGQPAQ